MPLVENYRRQVALLIKVVPFVATEKDFALKGGTAINLFVRNMPRFSVDLDLTYLPVADREKSLTDIDATMRRIADSVVRGIRGAEVEMGAPKGEKRITKLIVRADEVQMKIEVTPVLRGCVYEPSTKSVTPRVEEAFGFAEMQVVSFPDLYAGKVVAALDRSTHAISSMCAIFWQTKASVMSCGARSLCIWSAPTVLFPNCWTLHVLISRRNSSAASRA